MKAVSGLAGTRYAPRSFLPAGWRRAACQGKAAGAMAPDFRPQVEYREKAGNKNGRAQPGTAANIAGGGFEPPTFGL